jgi:diadenosine tetraphosphate (Ap4A) HIT family hydrolase
MATFNRSVARTLDFGETTNPQSATVPPTRTRLVSRRAGNPAGLHMHVLPWRSGDKYRVLEHRRRQAQITARRLLSVLDC